jgi:hypothetical protein
MLVVDFMHEFELGVWKLTFTHILRVLRAAQPGGTGVAELNARCASLLVSFLLIDKKSKRFRQIPAFGRGTIRKFARNVSEKKFPAARHFEDILQVRFCCC